MFKKITFTLLVVLLIGMLTSSVFAASKTVSVLGVWTGNEAEAFNKMVAPFEAETGIKVEFTGTRDLPAVLTTQVEAGNPPDVSAIPNPGQMIEFAKENKLVDLSTFMDMDVLRSDYSSTWIDLGTYQGKFCGVFISADLKSLVWYNPKAFAAAGYKVPTTWDEMIALSDKIVADGKTPWAIGLESGAASGWAGTDWIEDIMLRTVKPEVYDLWVKHGISWLDDSVQRAFDLFGQIALNKKYVYGGTNAELTINFGDSPDALFTTPPNAYLHRQATFIKSFILDHFPRLVPGEDFDFFPFPPIDPQYGTPALGAADMFAMFKDTPEARAFMEYIVSPAAQEIWIGELGKLSANKRVNPAVYPDDLTRKAAKILSEASTFRFDGSDLMPSAVGAGSFWTGILDYINGVSLKKVLMTIETTALDAYRK
ncbi:MAG: ABC transporter substrate-binding protein [Candidatus Infernicultor aquiphilus]|nr:MAG: ABC transporter substrate-binding protein [Candidatus Atribacteria bacterium CG08_land_8_20_14_0_20_33_29]PIW11701.1 MAG: ABC transporter substrate-binding protein [Candidatus Atribacteria bacterium CG17_big_fil_post_rev_8_21_14_2_50_34_11]